MKKANPALNAVNALHELNQLANVVGRLPARCDTIQSEILARLLAGGKPLTPVAAAQMYGAVNLSAYIDKLEKKFGWFILRMPTEVQTFNGRPVMTVGYWLSPWTIEAARNLYGTEWTDNVKQECASYVEEAKFCLYLKLRKDPAWNCFVPESETRALANHLYDLLGAR